MMYKHSIVVCIVLSFVLVMCKSIHPKTQSTAEPQSSPFSKITGERYHMDRGSLPNIVLILADDAGYADFGFMGSKDLQTPRIDELAADGVIFTDAHVTASVCAPSRAGLITGLYQQRFGHECNDIPEHLGLMKDPPTIGAQLKRYGYHTSILGKWHLGLGDEYNPLNRGFDHFYGFQSGARSYFPSSKDDQPTSPKKILNNRKHVHFEGYLTDRLGDEAVNQIEQQKQNPFFIFLSFNAVHTPMEAKDEHLEKFKNHTRQKLAAMTYSMDENVGKVIDKLKAEGLYENTLIFFLSDNGGAITNQSSNGNLKGWKGNKFEAGHRVPFVVSWPKEIEGGQTFDGLTSALDIFATAVGIVKDKREVIQMDGVNLIPYLKGKRTEDPHKTLFWRKDKIAAIRWQSDKMIRLSDSIYRVYDLYNDPIEENDVSTTHTETFETLKDQLLWWERDKQKPKWKEQEVWNEVTFEIHQALMDNREPNYITPGQMKTFRAEQSSSVQLFNGKNLDGWHIDIPEMDTVPQAGNPFIVRDGKLVSLGTPQGHLITNKKYKNYRLEVKYRFAGEPGNCGVLVHASTPRSLYKMFPKSIEVQMYHENAGDFWCIVEDIKVPNMEERRGPPDEWGITEGMKRRILNLTDGTENPLGEWNEMKIECLDDKVKVWLNGEFVNYGYESTATSGQIAVQAEGAEVEFEHIRLTPITKLTN